MKLINCCIAAMLCLCQLRAQTVGSLDTSFGMDGIVTINDGDADFFINLIQDIDNEFLVAYIYSGDGPISSGIRKYSVDGVLDNNFGTDGRVIFQYDDAWNAISDIKIIEDDKILIGGNLGSSNKRGFFVRLLPNGAFDESFGINGLIEDPISTPFVRQELFDIQSDGKILTLYNTGIETLLYRFNGDGSIDETFAENGKITLPFTNNSSFGSRIKVFGDDSFIIHSYESEPNGNELVVLKFLLNGEPDLSFGNEGEFRYSIEVSPQFPTDVAVQEDGKFILYYQNTNNNVILPTYLIRINTNGTLDEPFGNNGSLAIMLSNEYPFTVTDIFIEGNNEFLLSGSIKEENERKRVLSRYIDGVLDMGLGNAGLLTLDFTGDPSTSITSTIYKTIDEKILITGSTTLSTSGSAFGDVTIVRVFGDIDAAIGAPNQIDLDLKVIPNPVEDQLYFEFGLEEPTNLSASIYNSNGQLLSVAIPKERKTAGQHSMSCDVSHLPKGSYFLNLSTTEGEQSIQFIK